MHVKCAALHPQDLPISWRQSKKATRSKPFPWKFCAFAISNDTRSATPRFLLAFLRLQSIQDDNQSHEISIEDTLSPSKLLRAHVHIRHQPTTAPRFNFSSTLPKRGSILYKIGNIYLAWKNVPFHEKGLHHVHASPFLNPFEISRKYPTRLLLQTVLIQTHRVNMQGYLPVQMWMPAQLSNCIVFSQVISWHNHLLLEMPTIL